MGLQVLRADRAGAGRSGHIIDKGLPTMTGLLAQVLVAKYLEPPAAVTGRKPSSVPANAIARSTLAQWVMSAAMRLQPLVDALAAELLRQPVLHADETSCCHARLATGKTTLRLPVGATAASQFSPLQAVVLTSLTAAVAGHARLPPDCLGRWASQLGKVSSSRRLLPAGKVCFEMGVTEVGCMAHYPERRFMWVAPADQASRADSRSGHHIRFDDQSDCRNARRSALGFHDLSVPVQSRLFPERLHGVALHLASWS